MKTMAVLAFGLLVSAGLTGRADDKKDAKAEKLDPAKLVGEYTFVSGSKDGAKTPGDGFKGVALIVAKDAMTLKTPDGDFKFGYKVDASTTPASLDIEILEGPVGKGAKSKGIIALDGTTLKLAYHPMGGDRPKDFEGKKGSGTHVYVVKKADAKKKD